MRKVLGVAVCTLEVLLAASASSAAPDAGACKANYQDTGSFWSGHTFKTWKEYAIVSPAKAYQRSYAYLVKDGWSIVHADKDMGVISAATNVNSPEAKTAPLNVLVEEAGKGGSKVSVTFSIGGGMTAPHVADELCKIIDSVDGA